MWGVVCANDSDSSVVEGLAQGITVTLCLDGGVALDAGAQGGVVAVAEIEVGDGGLGSDARTLNFEL